MVRPAAVPEGIEISIAPMNPGQVVLNPGAAAAGGSAGSVAGIRSAVAQAAHGPVAQALHGLHEEDQHHDHGQHDVGQEALVAVADAQVAQAAATEAELEEEAGDLLFATVNWLRHLGINAETALRLATAKFERRFRTIEKDPRFATADLNGKEALWQAVKKAR